MSKTKPAPTVPWTIYRLKGTPARNLGRVYAPEQGVYKGRPPTIEAVEVRKLKERGLGATAIAEQLGIARASVYRVLQSTAVP